MPRPDVARAAPAATGHDPRIAARPGDTIDAQSTTLATAIELATGAVQHPEFVLAQRNIALATDKLRALEDAALRMSVFVVPLPDRVNALTGIARANGLFERTTLSAKVYTAFARYGSEPQMRATNIRV